MMRMTRFWIKLDRAVRLVLSTVENMVRGGEVFVPKIPSMKVIDLAAAMAPGCLIDEVGIRPGEKLHEVLISEDEARRTFEFDETYVIEPAQAFWEEEPVDAGKSLPEGFRYSSDTNKEWLTVEDFQVMAQEYLAISSPSNP